MSMKDIQKQVDEWCQRFKTPYFEPHQILAHLMEEVGELAREIEDRFGPKKKKAGEHTKDIGDELGDIIFTVICMANSQKIELDEAFKRVMDKCYGRDKDRYEKK